MIEDDALGTSEEVCVVATDLADMGTEKMVVLHLSNGLHCYIGMADDLVPDVGETMLVIYPNEHEVVLHLRVYGRIVPWKMRRGRFCVDTGSDPKQYPYANGRGSDHEGVGRANA